MKRKVLAKNNTELAEVLNLLDGKRKGLSRSTIRKVLKLQMTLETAAIKTRKYRSLFLMLRAQARRKAKNLKIK